MGTGRMCHLLCAASLRWYCADVRLQCVADISLSAKRANFSGYDVSSVKEYLFLLSTDTDWGPKRLYSPLMTCISSLIHFSTFLTNLSQVCHIQYQWFRQFELLIFEVYHTTIDLNWNKKSNFTRMNLQNELTTQRFPRFLAQWLNLKNFPTLKCRDKFNKKSRDPRWTRPECGRYCMLDYSVYETKDIANSLARQINIHYSITAEIFACYDHVQNFIE